MQRSFKTRLEVLEACTAREEAPPWVWSPDGAEWFMPKAAPWRGRLWDGRGQPKGYIGLNLDDWDDREHDDD